MGLVSRSPVKNTQTLIIMHDDDARTVQLWKETLCNNGENEALLSNFKHNDSVVFWSETYKVWVLVFLVRMSGTFWDQNWADLVKFFVLQQNLIVYSNSIHDSRNAAKYFIKWVG